MMVKGMGKVRSFRVSSSVLFGSALFLFLYLLVSIIVINDYLEKRRKNSALTAEVGKAQQEIEGLRRELERTEHRRALIERSLSQKEPSVTPAPTMALPQTTEVPEEEVVSNHQSAEVNADSPSQAVVDVKDLKLRRDGALLRVDFRVVNIREKEESVRGYVHVIAMDNSSNPPQFWTFPKVALKEGLPVEPKSGYLFVIRNYKTIRSEFFLNADAQSPSTIRFLIFDEAGERILEKEFEVGDSS